MRKLINRLAGKTRSLRKDRRGAAAVEYGLLVAVMAVGVVVAATSLGKGLQTSFATMSNALTGGTAIPASPTAATPL